MTSPSSSVTTVPPRPPRPPGGSGLVAHLAAHLAQEPALGGGEAADAARRDLVEHAVDLGLRGIALGPTRLPRVAPARRPRGVDEHAGRDRAPQLALRAAQPPRRRLQVEEPGREPPQVREVRHAAARRRESQRQRRSEEHTSELQSPCNLVCRLLLEKKKKHGNKDT